MTNLKDQIRKQMRLQLRSYDLNELKAFSKLAQEHLIHNKDFKDANSIGLYSSFDKEVETGLIFSDLIKRKKNIFFPKVQKKNRLIWSKVDGPNDLEHGYLGILEPKSNLQIFDIDLIDLLVVPGLAFDIQGRRLGKGMGFYDRSLKNYSGIRIALAYDFQIIAEVPSHSHDEKVDIIITPTREIYCSKC
ncbi:MAG: 5-formyltetrahydrofolate cyclo-ligase [Deltaproteobacteria bacterium]|nr:5-formyltetrahydrofolate cyclo-ligase [Deltaproteobacteria bacterium]